MVIFFFCFCSKSRLCSQHFVDGKPTQQHPYPTEELGYSIKRQPSVRKAPSVRLPLESSKRKRSQDLHMVQDTKSPDLQNDPFLVDAIARRSADSDMSDHCYTKSTVTHCTDCEVLQKQTAQLQQQLEQLQSSQKAPASPISIISRFVGTDAKVNLNTGIKDRATLDTLHFLLYPKVKKMRYWAGTRVATLMSASFLANPRCRQVTKWIWKDGAVSQCEEGFVITAPKRQNKIPHRLS